ncbi:MAG TPA: methyltransferase [Ktedonosporobacter sp.]|nr:methyltransferase [Ktedonosporobacter sp.]
MRNSACLLCDTVQLTPGEELLVLNSAAEPFVALAAQRSGTGTITLAEDNVATMRELMSKGLPILRQRAFHEYILRAPASTMDVAVMNLIYQPSKVWLMHGLQVALYALREGGKLYVVGAKDRGILSMAKRMQDYFGNVETVAISKGHRVLCSVKAVETASEIRKQASQEDALRVFADSQLDEGTRLLLETMEVRVTDEALDIGCGAGFIGLHIARQASQGQVTMVDASLAAVAVAQHAIEQSGLINVRVLASDGAQAVLAQRFDLVATNPPFHQGGLQTTAIAERFIREAAQVLRANGRFYLVANRFLKYEPTLWACFKQVEEVGGNTRYKVLRSLFPVEEMEEPC